MRRIQSSAINSFFFFTNIFKKKKKENRTSLKEKIKAVREYFWSECYEAFTLGVKIESMFVIDF